MLNYLMGLLVTSRDEEGQTAVEYALVIALVAIVLVGFLAAGGSDVFTTFWSTVSTALGGGGA